jgi:hypothetical protein
VPKTSAEDFGTSSYKDGAFENKLREPATRPTPALQLGLSGEFFFDGRTFARRKRDEK